MRPNLDWGCTADDGGWALERCLDICGVVPVPAAVHCVVASPVVFLADWCGYLAREAQVQVVAIAGRVGGIRC